MFMHILAVRPSSFLLFTVVSLLLFILKSYSSCKIVSSDRVFTLLFVANRIEYCSVWQFIGTCAEVVDRLP